MSGFVFHEDLFATVRRMSWKGAREATGSQNESKEVIISFYHYYFILLYMSHGIKNQVYAGERNLFIVL